MNLLEDKEVSLEEYMNVYCKRIIPESEKIFVRDFLFPILGKDKMHLVEPQYPFVDSEGHQRQIDFGIVTEKGNKIAFEVNGEVYHSEGIIPSEQFDDNLFRQNEILFHGWTLRRYSYNQLVSPNWRERIFSEIKLTLKKYAPELLSNYLVKPNELQKEVLPMLQHYRNLGWNKGLVIMPTGTGKTYLAAMDALDYYHKNPEAKMLFVVHRLDILTQAKNAFYDIWGNKEIFGLLTGSVKENVFDSRILFASKDSLCQDEMLEQFGKDYFDYIIVDEIHHGESATYKKVIKYFIPKFLLGVTATPERTDKKDILALFDYQKVCEYDINDAIDKGFLVSYNYHGLKDNIDYSNIRHNGIKYNEQDLERALIINERNEMIYDKYMEFCEGDKAIGFCVSINHAEAMSKLFNSKGIRSAAITSRVDSSETKAALIEAFKNNEIAVAFTVDIFNEGIDVPNVRALLFLRPTESKTIFLQQLGRGLRLSSNKESVTILDFISNYKRANYVRQYLSKNIKTKTREGSGAYEKTIYEYNPKCTVSFDDEVQQILDLQDEQDHEINKDDLIANYYDVMTLIKKKPNQYDLNSNGKYKSFKYINTFGSWIKFLREIGEITENGYHYPQGLHFGHIMYILKCIKNGDTSGNMNPKYIRMRGDLDSDGDIAKFQRQTKYKLQGMMGIGLLVDDRKLGSEDQKIQMSEMGISLYNSLKPLIDSTDLSFKVKDTALTWEMNERNFVIKIKEYLKINSESRSIFMRAFFNMDAVIQMLKFLYFDFRELVISKSVCYSNFFQNSIVKNYCDMNGIEVPSEEAAKHRIPFIISILECMGIVETSQSDITLKKLIVCDRIFDDVPKEDIADIARKIKESKYDEYLMEKFGKFVNFIKEIDVEVF